jgi:hypothetical protein
MGQEPPDSLKSRYLLFVADIDGALDDFFDTLYSGPQYPFDWAAESEERNRHANFVHNVWGQSIGYPEEQGCVFFRQFMHRCRIKVRLPFSAYDHTVADIVDAKKKQAMFANFVADTQSLDPQTLFSKWQDFRKLYRQQIPIADLVIDKSEDAVDEDDADEAVGVPPILKDASEQPHPGGS